MTYKLWRNVGGLKLRDYHKTESTQDPVTVLTPQVGELLIIPLQQHVGQKPEVCVAVGDFVHKGQCLAQPQAGLSAPIHASTSGTIRAIEPRPVPHHSGLQDTCIILEADGFDHWGHTRLPALDHRTQPLSDALQRIKQCGIVGLGGAVFPTATKLNAKKTIQTLIINGAECEPYISCDDLLMREQATEIVAGIEIIMHLLQAQECLIGIEDNKPEAIALMQRAAAHDTRLSVRAIPTLYPSGGAKQLTYILTGKEIPNGRHSAEIGVICQNVATARAVYRAIQLGEPLIRRYVTVTGSGVRHPRNVEVPLGTTMQRLIQAADGLQHTSEPLQLSMGGPMMALPLASDQIPVTKATNCLLVRPRQTPAPVLPCIRCGRCADVCPVNLLPQQLYWHARAKEFDKTKHYHLFACIECGCCDHVCPSNIPLVSYYRFAKAEIQAQQHSRQKADVARTRHEFRQERLERALREKAEKLAKHKTALKTAASTEGTNTLDPKKAAIQAALERANAKKAQQHNAQGTTQ